MPKAQSSSPERRLFDLWLGLRILSAVWLLFCGLFRPLTDRETTIPVWPPSAPYDAWLERVLFAPYERWDAEIFVTTLRDGYAIANGTAAFHPLLCLLAWPLYFVLGYPILALWIVASIASALAVQAFYKLARLDLDPDKAEMACRIFIALPVSAVMFVPYTEPLWILFGALTLLWARQGRWLAAGAAAAAATLARQQGIFLVLPLAVELWQARQWRTPRALAALAMAPAAYGAWIAYRAIALSDLQPDFSSFHSLLYTTVLSRASASVVEQQTFLAPWHAIWLAIERFGEYSKLNNAMNLGLGALFVGLAAAGWRYMRTSYRVFTAAIFLVSFSYHTGRPFAYMGLPRHLLLALPAFIAAAPVIAQGRRRHVVAAFCMPGVVFVLLCYVFEAWVP